MSKQPSKKAISAWVKLVRVQTLLLNQINDALKTVELPPFTWYDVLLELERSGQDGLRQFEIGDKMLLPKHNLSRLIDRLEAEGLVERQACLEDGRGNIVRLTPSGADLRKTMWPIYGTQLYTSIEAKLDVENLKALESILSKLLDESGDGNKR